MVSGEPTPNTNGTYPRGAYCNGYRTWTRTDGNWVLWSGEGGTPNYLTPEPGIVPEITDPYWQYDGQAEELTWFLSPMGTAAGNPQAAFPSP